MSYIFLAEVPPGHQQLSFGEVEVLHLLAAWIAVKVAGGLRLIHLTALYLVASHPCRALDLLALAGGVVELHRATAAGNTHS